MANLRIKLSLFINFFLFAILLNSIGTVILQVQRYFGVLESSAAILEAFKDISLAVISFVIASFITRIGYKKSMLLALATMAFTCFIIPSVKTFLAIEVLFAVTGACFGLMKISVLGTIGLITKDEREHISLMSFIESFFMVGILTGYFIFSYFIDDRNARSDKWFNIYYLLGLFSSLALFFLLFSPLDESSVKRNKIVRITKEFSVMMKLVLLPLVISFVVSVFLYGLIEQSIMSWLPTYNSKQLHLPSSMSIQITGLLAFSIAAGRFCMGFIIKRVSWIKLLTGCLLGVLSLVIITLPFASYSADHQVNGWSQVPWVAYIFPLTGFFLAPVYPVINSVILSSLPKEWQAQMAGLIIIFSAIGGVSGSLITGFIFQQYGGNTAFYFSLIPVVILIAILYGFKKIKEKRNKSGVYGELKMAMVQIGGIG